MKRKTVWTIIISSVLVLFGAFVTIVLASRSLYGAPLFRPNR